MRARGWPYSSCDPPSQSFGKTCEEYNVDSLFTGMEKKGMERSCRSLWRGAASQRNMAIACQPIQAAWVGWVGGAAGSLLGVLK